MIWIVLGVLLLAGCGILYGRQKRSKHRSSKIIKLSSARRKAGQQACSFCKKKAARLSFYASEQGQVVGVCDACKPQAERRALLRL